MQKQAASKTPPAHLLLRARRPDFPGPPSVPAPPLPSAQTEPELDPKRPPPILVNERRGCRHFRRSMWLPMDSHSTPTAHSLRIGTPGSGLRIEKTRRYTSNALNLAGCGRFVERPLTSRPLSYAPAPMLPRRQRHQRLSRPRRHRRLTRRARSDQRRLLCPAQRHQHPIWPRRPRHLSRRAQSD